MLHVGTLTCIVPLGILTTIRLSSRGPGGSGAQRRRSGRCTEPLTGSRSAWVPPRRHGQRPDLWYLLSSREGGREGLAECRLQPKMLESPPSQPPASQAARCRGDSGQRRVPTLRWVGATTAAFLQMCHLTGSGAWRGSACPEVSLRPEKALLPEGTRVGAALRLQGGGALGGALPPPLAEVGARLCPLGKGGREE